MVRGGRSIRAWRLTGLSTGGAIGVWADRYSARVSVGITVPSRTSTTWVIKSGISAALASTNISMSPVWLTMVRRSVASSWRLSASSPMKGLSIMSTLDCLNRALININLRSSPLDSSITYLSNSGCIWNRSYNWFRSWTRSSVGWPEAAKARSSRSPTVGVSGSISCEFQRWSI